MAWLVTFSKLLGSSWFVIQAWKFLCYHLLKNEAVIKALKETHTHTKVLWDVMI